jgi:hypothetical protein
MSINKRFIYSFANVETSFFDDTYHLENTKFKKYMRVHSPKNNIVGEVEDYKDNMIKISYTQNVLAGWNAELILRSRWINESECIPLDDGLNSSWTFDLEKFIDFYNKVLIA